MLAKNRGESLNGNGLFYLIGGILFFSILGYFLAQNYFFLALPVLPLLAIAFINNYKLLYYSFWMLLPFSIEFSFGSIGTDLPTEPIMLALTGIGIVLFLKNLSVLNFSYVFKAISLLLILHLVWTLFTALFSLSPIVSLKFFLAKIWYVIPFFFMTFHFIKTKYDVDVVIKIITVFLGIAVFIVLVRHALNGFTFATSHEVVRPIFRNHVNYSAIIVAFIPYCWALWRSHRNDHWGRVAFGALVLFVVGTYFSYTRAAQLCLFVAVGCYFLFKFKMSRPAIFASLIASVLLVAYLVKSNKYMDYAPNFERTVAHYKFDNLLEATYKMEDISTMERVYRWVAGGYMVAERPVLGHGPGSFYNHYTKYTVKSFETYVSDNPEKSGVHNYYLMILIEQGILGLIIWLLLIFSIILTGEKYIHQSIDREKRLYLYAATMSTVIICTMCIINDLIETDKVGPFFFLNAALILVLGNSMKKYEPTKGPSA